MANQQVATVEQHVEEEGHSVAGWTGVVLILLGLTVGAVAMYFNQAVIVYIGIALVVVGVIAWLVLQALGFGPKKAE